jgi:hypothetical protein
VTLVDSVEDLLYRLVNLGRVLYGHGSLQNTSSADILVNDSIEIFRLPKRILLEKELKSVIEDRDKRNRLLSSSLTKEKEVLNVLSIDQLLISLRECLENLFDCREWVIELVVVLNERLAARCAEAFLKSSDEVASQTLQALIDPARLVLHVHEVDHALYNFSVRHVL